MASAGVRTYPWYVSIFSDGTDSVVKVFMALPAGERGNKMVRVSFIVVVFPEKWGQSKPCFRFDSADEVLEVESIIEYSVER